MIDPTSHAAVPINEWSCLGKDHELSEKAVALTFDDGPAEWTSPILDILHKAEVVATFFVIG